MIQVKSLAKRFEDKEVIKGIDATSRRGRRTSSSVEAVLGSPSS